MLYKSCSKLAALSVKLISLILVKQGPSLALSMVNASILKLTIKKLSMSFLCLINYQQPWPFTTAMGFYVQSFITSCTSYLFCVTVKRSL